MNRTPCYFHSQPGGCRKGATCRFSHDGPGPSLFGPARSSSNPFDTSPAPPGVCRFYWTRGTCTRGTSCFFKHQAADGSPSASSAGSPTASRPSSPVAFQKPAPPGTCRFFWTTGKCNREFACTFRHESPAASADAEGSWRARATPQAPAFALSIGRGVRRELAPADVQTRLLPFLKEGFTFDSAGKIYTFVHLLSCATPTNKSWTSEDGQLLLEKIASVW
ncbi:hypothetical protein EXIGLDRAFT_766612 [Exidia glandulosa HHB12029]|uniref:C3H1-type domain-containing protein n=1 Tax=Exidia glandulosa HHB12029 TaxID=1314781 RepID=A0A165JLJ9_EXIGL|nr:hypothetical protein EXIGLDRAFT_766612 [Exidia glandulosa HHB12029]